MCTKKATKHVLKQGKVLQIEPNMAHRNKRNPPKSLIDHLISQPIFDISPIWTPVISAEVRKLQLHPVQIMCDNCFYVGTWDFLALVMTLFWLTTTAVKQCLDIGARLHACGVFFNVFNFCPNSRRWFMLRWCSCPETGNSSINWAQVSWFDLKTETESSLWNIACFK
jgi:hypothetical protein